MSLSSSTNQESGSHLIVVASSLEKTLTGLEINKGNNNDRIGASIVICRTIQVQSGIPPPILPIRFSSFTFGSEPTSPFYCVLMLVGNDILEGATCSIWKLQPAMEEISPLHHIHIHLSNSPQLSLIFVGKLIIIYKTF
ncbi:hypothetical protein CXB51_032639 [Gossypium anomalum]|uniref:Uncharacterized protein n=1 Tax=Gossypium anomalum TaxID=47600 RepID=A0A8J5YSD1_9ROSI|nr:hypothetical protein CXB51_032639 [Gossypium anomalum]